MRHVIVTGGAGLIGNSLIRKLLHENVEVTVIDNFSRGIKSSLQTLPIKIVDADLLNSDSWSTIFADTDTVFHLAAKIGSIDYLHGSLERELSTLDGNSTIDRNVFHACVENEVPRVVYTSSVSVYPLSRQMLPHAKLREDDLEPVNPDGGYGWAKLLGERALNLMPHAKIGIARIFITYGPYCSLSDTAHVIPSLIKKAIAYPKEKFTVWGNGEQSRTFMYIDDCVDALLLLEKRVTSPPIIVNVGSTEEIWIRDLVNAVIKISGKSITPEFDETKQVGPTSRIPIIEKASELGWMPKVPLREGLPKVYDWIDNTLEAWKHG